MLEWGGSERVCWRGGSGQPHLKPRPHSVPDLGRDFTSLSLGFFISHVRVTTLCHALL